VIFRQLFDPVSCEGEIPGSVQVPYGNLARQLGPAGLLRRAGGRLEPVAAQREDDPC
jgi:hypothetical protein